jgi:hypothetical protein
VDPLAEMAWTRWGGAPSLSTVILRPARCPIFLRSLIKGLAGATECPAAGNLKTAPLVRTRAGSRHREGAQIGPIPDRGTVASATFPFSETRARIHAADG